MSRAAPLLRRVFGHDLLLLTSMAAALAAFAWLYLGPMIDHDLHRFARWLAADLRALSSEPTRLQAKLDDLEDRLGSRAFVVRRDGVVVGAPHDAALPVSAAAVLAATEPVSSLGAGRLVVPEPDLVVLLEMPAPVVGLRTLGLALAGALLLSVLAAVPLARGVARPLADLAELARRFGQGELGARVAPSSIVEVNALGHALHEMAERIEGIRASEREFLANLSHELRTPIARIRVVLELAERGDPSAARRYLTELGEDVEELNRLTGDLLSVARFELTEAPRTFAAVALDELIAPIAERLAAQHGRPAASVVIGGAQVSGDRAWLKRVFENLLDNAYKYSPQGGPIDVQARATPGGVRVTIQDSGPGIPAADLPRVFESFFRGDRSRSRETGGFGLGLHLSKRIVDAHRGRIWIESGENRGTTVFVELPAPGA